MREEILSEKSLKYGSGGTLLETIQTASKLPLIFGGKGGKRVSLRKSLSISLSQTITETSRIRLEKGDQIGNSPPYLPLTRLHLNEIFKKRLEMPNNITSNCLRRQSLIRWLQKLARQTKLVLCGQTIKNLGFMQWAIQLWSILANNNLGENYPWLTKIYCPFRVFELSEWVWFCRYPVTWQISSLIPTFYMSSKYTAAQCTFLKFPICGQSWHVKIKQVTRYKNASIQLLTSLMGRRHV